MTTNKELLILQLYTFYFLCSRLGFWSGFGLEMQLPVCQFMLINNAICADFSILFGTRLHNLKSAASGCGYGIQSSTEIERPLKPVIIIFNAFSACDSPTTDQRLLNSKFISLGMHRSYSIHNEGKEDSWAHKNTRKCIVA